MERQLLLQDVMRCYLCEEPVPSRYCAKCQKNLCEKCHPEHVSDSSKTHYIVPFRMRRCIRQCTKHTSNICQFRCDQCNTSLCILCNSSEEHKEHTVVDILEYFESKKKLMQKDSTELEKSIFPKYQEAAANIPDRKANAIKNSTDLKADVDKQGEVLRPIIDSIVHQTNTDIDNMKSEYLQAIEKQEDEINRKYSLVEERIAVIKKMLNSDKVNVAFDYQSKNEEFRSFPPPIHVSYPSFTPYEINEELLQQQFNSLPNRNITYPLLDEPRILKDIYPFSDTEIEIPIFVLRVSCMNDDKFWLSGFDDSELRLYNVQGDNLTKIETLSKNRPRDIAVTKSGDLVYTDLTERSINLVEVTNTFWQTFWWKTTTEIRPLIPLQEWNPRCVCCSKISGDLLVTMDNEKQSKVVRYSGIPGLTEKRSIQWDDQGQPLYSLGEDITENTNSDICVADSGAIVVVTEDGKLRFRYTGPPSANKELFYACAITTDNLGKILIADKKSKYIHILDQDGHIFHYLYIPGLGSTCALCLDSTNNLFVAEAETGKIKIIQYYK